MNVYVVVEGKGDRIVYRSWIPLVNPDLRSVDSISEVTRDNFYIVSGMGYPHYFEIIDNAISDVNSPGSFDRLVVSVDSEDMNCEENIPRSRSISRVSHVPPR